jgi:hypothetical protein
MATSEQWADIEQWATQTASSCDACLLELNERLKSLEEDCYEDNRSNHFVIQSLIRRIEVLEAKINDTN